jgi:hypothetical protein
MFDMAVDHGPRYCLWRGEAIPGDKHDIAVLSQLKSAQEARGVEVGLAPGRAARGA